MAPKLVTLPQLAKVIGVEYRTLHSWVGKGIVRPSVQASRGAGMPNLFNTQDVVKAKVVADLRQTGVSFELLRETSQRLEEHPHALISGAVVLVNGSVTVVDPEDAAATIQRETITVAYNTRLAVQEIEAVLPAAV